MYKVLMRDNETKEEKLIPFDFPWHDSSLFLWQEGNFSCECNRYEFFHDIEDDDIECGDTKITAVYAELENGERIIIDA